MKKTFSTLAISDIDEFVFGRSPKPVTLRNGMVIGGGVVYPELNFTLPTMEITEATMGDVKAQYTEMITETARRAGDLHLDGFVVEFELLPPLTLVPEWGAEITAILRDALDSAAAKFGMKVGLRVTPNDIREFVRPPRLRSGEHVETMMKSFSLCAKAGADMLAIESTGGKELHDDALLNGDLALSVFSMGVLGSRDMARLWENIVAIADEYHVIPSGDSACGFANTAMVLADQHQIPKVWAATVRVMSVARSLVAFEQGAVGPGKDCAYEGVFTKAITGCPIALEGAEAACAHLSAIGNIAKATADLWSNESVQNVKLLSAMAPVVSLEQLVYATRLMNTASVQGPRNALLLRDMFVDSDATGDPQAYVLRPDIAMSLSRDIIAEPSSYLRTRQAARATLALIRSASSNDVLHLPPNELRWLDRLSRAAESLPDDEDEFIAGMVDQVERDKVRLEEYIPGW